MTTWLPSIVIIANSTDSPVVGCLLALFLVLVLVYVVLIYNGII